MSVTGKALWYIESHLEGDVSLDAVADSAGVSRYHLSRAFTEAIGYPLGAYVRGRRLSEAAKKLAGGAPDILALALEAGYGSHEAFTRAFRQEFGVTPDEVRSREYVQNLEITEPVRMDTHAKNPIAPPRIVEGEPLLIFGVSERYSCHDKSGIPAQWARMVPHIGTIREQKGAVAYGVVYNSDEEGNFEYLCGVEVSSFPQQPAEFARLRIPAQTYAVFEHKEHVSSIASTFKAIWDEGLASAGLKAADGALFERYGPEFDGRTGLGGFEIWVPVKG